ncbi:MAG: ATP-binding protein, partial [Clostridium sp.]|nr:ATP-binding protein [Clostridium sp.]
YYIERKLEHVSVEVLYRFLIHGVEEEDITGELGEYIRKLIMELEKIDMETLSDIANELVEGMYDTKEKKNMRDNKRRALSILKLALQEITSDTKLVKYAKQSINASLAIEFAGQIQPVAFNDLDSEILLYRNEELCYKLHIKDNQIVNSNEKVFSNAPFKQSYFIDNPFILDDPVQVYRRRRRGWYVNDSFFDTTKIVTHDNKLKQILNADTDKTVFEAGIIEKRYRNIKDKIDEILPGSFTVNDGERYYVNGNVKLKTVNLAAGSKMFSIIKMLLEKGEIDDSTLLILDEPECHLHPKWQNAFAEVITLLVKEVGCHILLTTHSSNFMLAIDAYMRKYDISSLCNFYQTEHIEDGNFVAYRSVNDSMEDIYRDFVTYFSDVKMLRDEYC